MFKMVLLMKQELNIYTIEKSIQSANSNLDIETDNW